MPIHQWTGLWSGRQPVGDIHHRAREIVRRTGGIVRGKFPSKKNGRMVHHEGLLELDAIYLFETSPRITRYREQPETIRYDDGNTLRSYTPDFELQLISGITVLIEVKPSYYYRAREVRSKLDLISKHMALSHLLFEVLTEQQMRPHPFLDNLRLIYHHASRAPRNHSVMKIALDVYRDQFPMPIAQAIGLFAKHSFTPYCLLLAGLVRCEIDKPIGLNTTLHLREGIDHDWLFSTQGNGF
jgi:hypothetical protein